MEMLISKILSSMEIVMSKTKSAYFYITNLLLCIILITASGCGKRTITITTTPGQYNLHNIPDGFSPYNSNMDLLKNPPILYTVPYEEPAPTVNISFAGDLCLSEDWYTLNKYDESSQNLENCISKELIDITNSADIFCLNNEFTFSENGAPLEGKYYTFRARPERAEILKTLGVDTVSLSNNHIFDFGEQAFYDTLNTLDNNDITYFGAGKNLQEACKPVYITINDIKIGFVGASRAEKLRLTPGATDNSPGILLAYDYSKYLEVIKEAKKNCDYLIAYIHWGTEDSHSVTDYQHKMGYAFIDAGADAIIGGHPHVLQGIEYYKNRPIVYSLGDFWFNYEKKETGIINLSIDNTGLKELSFVPCLQADYTTTLQTGDNATHVFNFLKDLSFNIDIDESGIITPTQQ